MCKLIYIYRQVDGTGLSLYIYLPKLVKAAKGEKKFLAEKSVTFFKYLQYYCMAR